MSIILSEFNYAKAQTSHSENYFAITKTRSLMFLHHLLIMSGYYEKDNVAYTLSFATPQMVENEIERG